MKTFLFSPCIILAFSFFCFEGNLFSQVKIGDNPVSVDPSAVFELEKSNLGMLIPRITLTGAADQTTITAPANSLLIYNTATAGEGNDVVTPGFYYWNTDAGRWMGLVSASRPIQDIWIDSNNNLMSRNSGNQSLPGNSNVVLGEGAFQDIADPSAHIIAIGSGACRNDSTSGDGFVVGIGTDAAYYNAGTHVSAIGYESGKRNTAGHVNAFGNAAGYANQGNDVNAIGFSAAAGNQGFEVNALGPEAARENTGNVVNAIGWQSAEHNAGNDVNAFGVRAAQYNNASGSNMNAMGIEAGMFNMGGAVNFFGEGAGRNNEGSLVNAFGGTAGENNTGWSTNFLGNQSGQYNSGAEVNAMGAMAAQYNTHASVNAFGLTAAQYNHNEGVNALGWRAGQYNTGFQVNALGGHAARFSNGDHVVALGEYAVMGDSAFVDEGIGTIGIGYSAASNIGGGSFNICLGFDADIPDSTASYQINIGNNIIRETSGMIRMKDFLKLTPLDAPPATTEEGTIYYDATDHKLYVRTDTGWQALW